MRNAAPRSPQPEAIREADNRQASSVAEAQPAWSCRVPVIRSPDSNTRGPRANHQRKRAARVATWRRSHRPPVDSTDYVLATSSCSRAWYIQADTTSSQPRPWRAGTVPSCHPLPMWTFHTACHRACRSPACPLPSCSTASCSPACTFRTPSCSTACRSPACTWTPTDIPCGTCHSSHNRLVLPAGTRIGKE